MDTTVLNRVSRTIDTTVLNSTSSYATNVLNRISRSMDTTVLDRAREPWISLC
jgi:hypothetical protein